MTFQPHPYLKRWRRSSWWTRLGEGDLPLIVSAQGFLQFRALFVAHDIEVNVDSLDVRHLHDRVDHPIGDRAAHGAAFDRQIDPDLDHPAFSDVDALEHAYLGDRSIDLRIIDSGEGFTD